MEGDAEVRRLQLKTVDDETRDQLRLVGLDSGMRALDVGCGSGAVTRVMAAMVGPSGLALGVDGSPSRVAAGSLIPGEAVALFTSGSLLALPVRPIFDLVWCRFVLEYQHDPLAGIAEMLEALRPGGKLVVGDVDDHGLRHFPAPELVTRGLEVVSKALEGRFDPWMGRRLFNLMRRAGAVDIRAHVLPYHVYAGRAPDDALENWALKWQGIREQVVPAFGSPDEYDEFVEAFTSMLLDDDVFTYSSLILVEGRRP